MILSHGLQRRWARAWAARSVTTYLLVAALALGLAACGEDDPKPKPTPPTDAQDDAGTEPGPLPVPLDGENEEPAFATAAQCGKCHTEIYKEWRQSFHGRAMSDPLFLELSADVNKEECIRCHAPVSLREAEFETPVARSANREDAISCLSCHQKGGQVAGPFGGLSGACRPVGDAAQRDVVKVCFPCHNQHDTGNEWMRGPYAPDAPLPKQRASQDCLDCHMPMVERPLVKGGPVRKGRRHTWAGGHSFSQLKRAAKVDVEVKPMGDGAGGFRIEVFVTNTGAGHAIPTDARHRSFDTYLKLWDENGNVVLDPLRLADQSKSHLAKFRKFYRGSGQKDTQIPPLERVSSLGEGPGFLEFPNLKGGRGEAWLVYRLTPRDVLTADSLDAHKGPDDVEDPTLARVVERVSFEVK